MSFGRNKFQSRENRARVREILMRHWDPIGICDVEEAADEYDACVDRAYVMLMDEQANAKQLPPISSRLQRITWGYRPTGPISPSVVQMLRRHWLPCALNSKRTE
ncbi:MAG TPA: hypothetical protein VJ790_00750 [Dongiaceae bacterium]|nr:hypothetical protein [Dongiaceae bacterium]